MESQPKPSGVLYVITQGNWGGAQRYVYDLSAKISQKMPITVAVGNAPAETELATQLQKADRALVTLHHLKRAISPYHDILAVFELHQLYKKINPAIVHLNSSKAGVIGSLAALGLHRRPAIVYTAHGWVFREPLNWLVKKLYTCLEKWTAHLKDAIIVLSPEEKADAEKILKINPNKIKLTPLAIEPPRFLAPETARQTILNLAGMSQSSGPLIGTIANLYANKGIDILIAAAQTIPTIHFFVIGSGPEELHLKKMIVDQKITNVNLLGARPNAAELLPAFDLFVLPSRKEGLPYTILEAMAAKLPIVATTVGGLPTLAQKYPMALVTPNQPQALAEAITLALQKKESAYATHPFPVLQKMVEETIMVYSAVSGLPRLSQPHQK